MAARRVELGAVGEMVRAAIRTNRNNHGWRLEDLSARLQEQGRPMSKATLSQIETGGRRVDVDDLVAIARALEVEPVILITKSKPFQAEVMSTDDYEEYLQFLKLPEEEQERIQQEIRDDYQASMSVEERLLLKVEMQLETLRAQIEHKKEAAD
jgi:transcriptional regulator with XRE-family HTH domain